MLGHACGPGSRVDDVLGPTKMLRWLHVYGCPRSRVALSAVFAEGFCRVLWDCRAYLCDC